MRRLILLLVLAILLLVVVVISRVLPASAKPPTPMTGPACAFVCDKTGINTGWPGPGPEYDYLHAQRLGMGWIMQVAGGMQDVNKTAEAINRANAGGLRAIVRICSGDTCELGTPALYSAFLHAVAQQATGEFWALMGPNEPDLEHWAGDGTGVAAFMNGTLSLVGDIPNLKKLSPAFNLTNKATPSLLKKMDAAGAQWSALDGFAGTSYNLGGHPAYGYYKGGSGLRKRVLLYGKPFIFIETGTFAMVGKDGPGNPKRAKVVAGLRKDFGLIVNDPTVMGVMYFNAFGNNPYMLYHVLYDPELVAISQDAPCTGGGYSPVGIGVSTSQQTWRASGAPACTVSLSGCPFVSAVACAPPKCVDNDGDTLPGDGMGCERKDCNDDDPSVGLSCGAGADDQAAGWGTLRVVDANVPAPRAWPVIKLGAGGLPVIGYRSGPQYQGDVTFLQCTDTGCSKALRRVLVTANDSGAGLSMQVRSDGRPIFSYLNNTDFYLETYSCANSACASGGATVMDINVGQNGFETSLALLSGDVPSMAYWASGTGDLGVVTCPGGNCGSVTPYVRESSGQTGRGPTMFKSQSGPPYVVYSRESANQLRLLRCTDDVCSGGAKLTLTSPALSLPTSGVVVRGDGKPLILYRNLAVDPGEALALYSCVDALCTPPGTMTDIYSTGSDDVVIDNGSITLLSGGGLFIAISERNISTGDTDLILIYCQDTACTAPPPSIDRVSDGNVGEHPDVVIRSGDNPMVVYHDVGNGRLMVYDVDQMLMTGTPQPTTPPTATPEPTVPGSTPAPTATPAPWAAPVPKSPRTGILVRGTPAFSWGKVKGATLYQFEYDEHFDFDTPVFNSGPYPATNITPPSMAKGIYFWRVRAGNGAAWTEWSVPRTVQIALPLPGKLSILTPRSGLNIPGGVPGLSWKPASGAAQYEVWIDVSKSFNNPSKLVVPALSTSIGPLPPGTYFWRVRGLNPDGEAGPWSAVKKFIIP